MAGVLIDDRALLDIILEGEDDAGATSAMLPFDSIKTRIYELRVWLSRRVLGIRIGLALAVLLPLSQVASPAMKAPPVRPKEWW